MIAVGTHNRLRESNGRVASRPMESRLEHNFLCWVALRLVETRGWLGFAEDVGHAVIADAIARAEVAVGVVVKGAPADAPGVLRVRSQLIVNAGMAHRMLGEALHLIDSLGGIGVADEFGVQISRMIRRLQRKTEVVHGENIFEKFRLLKVADASGLAGRVQLVGHRVGANIEIVVVFGLVDAHTPQNDGRMVPVAANHAAHVVDGDQFPGLVADVLPSGNFLQHEQARFHRRRRESGGTGDNARCERYCT